MDVKIKETGEIKKLRIIDRGTGVDWIEDLIGNADGFREFGWDDEDGVRETSQETYDWWAQYIQDTETTEAEIIALAERLKIDESSIRDAITEATGNDYNDHRSQAIHAMRSIETSHAAAALGRISTEKKASAARENGRKGGRPRKA